MMQDQLAFAAALWAAGETSLLTALLGGPRTPAEYSKELSLDGRATERVLQVLVAYGIAVERDGLVSASDEFKLIARLSPGGLTLMFNIWSHTRTFLRTGEPFMRMDDTREESYRGIVGGLGKFFEAAATDLAARIERAPSRVLDIGCGSGVWSLAIAERFPDTHVTGLDLPTVLEAFDERVAELGLSSRTDTIAGDVHKVDIPRAFDLVLIANVLRIEPPDRARRIVERAAQALLPGGQLIVVDALSSGTVEREQARAVYALHLAMRTAQGRVHSPSEIMQWLCDAGLTRIEQIPLSSLVGAVGALIARAG